MSGKTASYVPPGNTNELTLAWIRRARESQLCHYHVAQVLSARERWLGVPVIVITAVVGTSLFASTAMEEIPAWSKIVVGGVSVVAAVLSSLQTFFNYTDRAEKHRIAAAKFGASRRRLEEVYARREQGIDLQLLGVLRDELDSLGRESPHVPPTVYERIQRRDLFVGTVPSGATAAQQDAAPVPASADSPLWQRRG